MSTNGSLKDTLCPLPKLFYDQVVLAGQKTEKSHGRQQQLPLPGWESRVPGGWEPLSSDMLPAQLGVLHSMPGTGSIS